MRIEDVAEMVTYKRFIYWIKEREKIRCLKRSNDPKPWTDDTILQSYSFCNVRRMDDRVSKWLLHEWYIKDHKNIVTAAALARLFNLPASLEAIGFPKVWLPKRVDKIMETRREAEQQCFNGAYIVTGKFGGGSKAHQVVWKMVNPIFKSKYKPNTNLMEETHSELMQFDGIGSFTAGQIVADLRWVMKGKWKDRSRWAPIGPGSRRGMNRLNSDPIKTGMKQPQFEKQLQKLIERCARSLPYQGIVRRLEAIDYQNCLCEWDKYERTLHGEGRPKRKYNGCD